MVETLAAALDVMGKWSVVSFFALVAVIAVTGLITEVREK